MFKNYFKTAFRNLWKNKISNFMNLAGLAIGMACCMLILIYIKDELSYNKFNARVDDIYMVQWNLKGNEQPNRFATTPVTLGPAIASDLPQVEQVCRMFQRSGQMSSGQGSDAPLAERRFQEQNVYFSDKNTFKVFSIDFIAGNRETALGPVNTVVITDEMAKKYFGNANPLGKTLVYDNHSTLQVTGVVKKLPANSDISFDFLISFETLFSVETESIAKYLRTDWNYNPCNTYILASAGTRRRSVEGQLNGLIKKYGDERAGKLYHVGIEPLSRVHLYDASVAGNPSTNSITYVYIFSGIAFLILAIANMNFINLSTARSNTRAQEVGMRKVIGASKKQLIVQFLSENILAVLFAFILALILTHFGLPLLNQLTNKQLPAFSWLTASNILLFALIFFGTGIIAGLYPAFFITRFNMAQTVKRKSGDLKSQHILRKTLLVVQFSISIFLIIGAIVIYQQLQYMRNKPLGFQKSQMLVVPIFGSGASSIGYGVDLATRQKMTRFTEELLKLSRIKAATSASALPGQGFVRGLVIPQGYTDKDNIFVPWISVDYNFISTLNIPVIAGRDFSKATGTDHLSAFILSEAAVRSFNWKSPEDAIGKTIIRGDSQNGKKGQVIGVIKDFNFNTLDQPTQPLIIDVSVPRFTQFAISIQADHVPQTIAFIRQTWDAIFPERVFEYSFLDKTIDALYNDKENLSRMIGYFAVVAILLSCMGLFSLTLFMSIQRTREIGIRKVLGATVPGIVGLLSREFLLLALLSFVIASPLAWFAMGQWLQNYAFRIDIAWWVFLVAGGFVLIATALTVGFQSLRAAVSNPVNSLRSE